MRELQRRLLVLGAVVALLGLPVAATALSPLAAPSSPQITMISIPQGAGANRSLEFFSPGAVTVVIGVNNTVTWTDNDNTMDANGYEPNHIVAADDKSFTSDSLSIGDHFTYTFTTPGTYSYHCSIHAWMKGIVTVKGSAAPVPEFPFPLAVFLVALSVAAAIFGIVRRKSPETYSSSLH